MIVTSRFMVMTFFSTGDQEDARWLQTLVEERFEISKSTIGHDIDDEK